MIYCRIHRTIDCKKCASPRAMLNEFRHRMKRCSLGLTICAWCKDNGYINTYSHGRLNRHKCGCRCLSCNALATFLNGYCGEHQDDVPTPLNLDLIDLKGLLE